MHNEFGDFQTPRKLVSAVLECVYRFGREWTRALEPTCGIGNFIDGLCRVTVPPREIQGFEVQEQYTQALAANLTIPTNTSIAIKQANIFDINFATGLTWSVPGPLLVIGNPPWVTNAELGTIGSSNLPLKSNVKNLAGIDAMTGGGNFDIAEFIVLKLIRELKHERPTIAMLCKTAVARNVIQFVAAQGIAVNNIAIRHIDAKKWFRAAVDACLFSLDVGQGAANYEAQVYADLESIQPTARIGMFRGQLSSHSTGRPQNHAFDGTSSLEWRSGIKHDVASVVELTLDAAGSYRNKHHQIVQIEAQYIYPLLKSSDLAGRGGDKTRPHRAIIMHQQRMGEDTRALKVLAPQLWAYYSAHSDAFAARKSAIYRNQPPFAFFGIGDYTFSPFKVAISGMYKTPKFRAIGPLQGKPVMFDDTCYFLSCTSAQQAALITSILNSPITLEFLDSIAFWDSKRPITKKLLQRIDLIEILRHIDRHMLLDMAGAEMESFGNPSETDLHWPAALEEFLINQKLPETDHIQLTLME